MSKLGIIMFGLALLIGGGVASSGAQSVSRPFPIVQVQIGDVPVALPRDWVETKFVKILSDKDKTISIVNANLRQPPRSTHFDVPPLALFDAVGVPPGIVEQNPAFGEDQFAAALNYLFGISPFAASPLDAARTERSAIGT
jgi:hypothetical protein